MSGDTRGLVSRLAQRTGLPLDGHAVDSAGASPWKVEDSSIIRWQSPPQEAAGGEIRCGFGIALSACSIAAGLIPTAAHENNHYAALNPRAETSMREWHDFPNGSPLVGLAFGRVV